MVTGQFNKKDW